MSADILRRAAAKLRDPLLCNFDRTLALALADWLDDPAVISDAALPTCSFECRHRDCVNNRRAFAVARAVLREDGEQR